MIGKIVDKGTIKSLNNALHLKKYNHLLIFYLKIGIRRKEKQSST